jgi:hypothetical protein
MIFVIGFIFYVHHIHFEHIFVYQTTKKEEYVKMLTKSICITKKNILLLKKHFFD